MWEGIGHFKLTAYFNPLLAIQTIVETGYIFQIRKVAFSFQEYHCLVQWQTFHLFRLISLRTYHYNLLYPVFILHTYEPIFFLKKCKTCKISFFHIRYIHRSGSRTYRTNCSLRQCISCRQEISVHPSGFKAQIPFSFTNRPKGIVRIVIPLPNQWQSCLFLLACKLIRSHDARYQSLTCRKFQPLRHFPVYTKNRPTFFPLHRNKIRNTTYRTIITEKISKPSAIRRIYQTSLCNTFILQGYPALPRPVYMIGAMNNHRAHSTFGPGDVEQVILSIHLKQLRAFGRQTDIIP